MALPTHTQLHLDQMLAPPAAPARYFTTSPAPMTTEERDTSELDWSPPPRNRYHFSYAPPHPAPENDQEEDDPTESEELALVRTANASRLRRRGAIRIESDGHGGVGLSPSYSPYAHVPPPMLSERRRTVHAHADDVDGREEVATFELYCGGPVARDINPPSIQVQSPYSASTPYSTPKRRYVNPLPQPLPDSTPHHSIVPRTNGCGALVHISAVPSSKPGHWVAPISGATEDIAVLDGMYYDGREWLGKSPCGCVTEAAGCLTCGNTLGTLLTPCIRHAAHPPEAYPGRYRWSVPAYQAQLYRTFSLPEVRVTAKPRPERNPPSSPHEPNSPAQSIANSPAYTNRSLQSSSFTSRVPSRLSLSALIARHPANDALTSPDNDPDGGADADMDDGGRACVIVPGPYGGAVAGVRERSRIIADR